MSPRRIIAATVATIIVLASSYALLMQPRLIIPGASPLRVALRYFVTPGMVVGTALSLVLSRSIHNSSFWLAFLVSIPTNWLIYYGLLLGILKVCSGEWRTRSESSKN